MKTKNTFLRSTALWALALVFGLPLLVRAQTDFKGIALPSSVNTAYDELVPRLSPDDQTLYFVRLQHPENVGGRGGGQDIWYCTRTAGGEWSTAQNAGTVLNNQHHNFVGAVIEDGNALLLGNSYGVKPEDTRPGISISRKIGGVWTMPTVVMGEKSFDKQSKFIDFCATADGKVMIVSLLNPTTGEEDLAVCFAQGNGFYSPPQPLGDIINTEEGYETGPFLSADSKMLFFTSNGHGGRGNADIFVTTRLDDSWSNWSEPVNLGPEVNTNGFDGHFIVDSRFEKAYFVSGPNADALGDIYEIPVRDIPALRPASVDTLRIMTVAGVPVELELEPYGINPQNANYVSLKPIDGPGQVMRSEKGTFVYRPSGVFQGVEHVAVELCDPPQSDNCRKVIVEAQVGTVEKPAVVQISIRTPKNTSVGVNVDIDGISLSETRRNYANQLGPKGEISVPAGIEPTFFYQPPVNYVGSDSVRIYGICPNGETSNCLRAVVQIEVYEVPPTVVVVEEPVKPEEPIKPVEEPVKPLDVVVSGTVTDDKTGKPLDAEVVFYDHGKVVASTKSEPVTGAYSVTLPAGVDYLITAKQPYYFELSDAVNTGGKAAVKGQMQKDLKMTPMVMEVGQTFVLKNIYFDLDKSILKPESKEELTRLYELLKNNPTMEIQVNGHTDSQSDDAYNQRLSESRAFAVVNYLKYKGVMGYRISSKGFGEKVPVATNETVEGRGLNRRVEFTVTKI